MNDLWLGVALGAGGVIVLAAIVWHSVAWSKMMQQYSARHGLDDGQQD